MSISLSRYHVELQFLSILGMNPNVSCDPGHGNTVLSLIRLKIIKVQFISSAGV